VSLRALILEIDPDIEPVSGWVSDEHGGRRSFSGWLGLAATLERLIGDPDEGTPDERGDQP